GIRDMAGDLDRLIEWKKEQAEGRLAGPEMGISRPFLDGSAKGFSLPSDVIEVSTPEIARSKVRELKSRGADFIKVGSQLSLEVFDATAAECKLQGISFAGHVPDVVTVEHATSA